MNFVVIDNNNKTIRNFNADNQKEAMEHVLSHNGLLIILNEYLDTISLDDNYTIIN